MLLLGPDLLQPWFLLDLTNPLVSGIRPPFGCAIYIHALPNLRVLPEDRFSLGKLSSKFLSVQEAVIQ